jgi:hypothetical protein
VPPAIVERFKRAVDECVGAPPPPKLAVHKRATSGVINRR